MTPTQIQTLLAEINEKLNLITTNAKTILQFEEQLEALGNSFLVVNVDGITKKIKIQTILDGIQNYSFNQILAIGEITVVDNDVTIPAGCQWQISAVTYFTATDTVFDVPFAASGLTRIDIIVATASNTLVKYSGLETDGIAIRPNIPLNTVLVTQINVTEAAIGAVPEPTYLSIDERAAITYSNAPSEENPFATMDDIETPTLQQVTEAGNEIVSDDGLLKIVLNKALGRMEIYSRADVGDAFVLQATYGSSTIIGNLIADGYSFKISDNIDGTYNLEYAPYVGFNINDGAGNGVVLFQNGDIQIQKGGNTLIITTDTITDDRAWYFIDENGDIVLTTSKTSSFTAVNSAKYTANGTLTVTDPTPVANKGYVVHVIGGTATIGGVDYTSGALVYRYYNGSVWVSKDYGASITIDSNPTDGSANAVSSNGVFDALALKADNSIIDRFKKGVEFFTDFDNTASNITGFVNNTSAGGTAVLATNAIPNRAINQNGFAQYQTATSSTSYFFHQTALTYFQIALGGGVWIYEIFLCVETLSDATERFNFRAGFGSSNFSNSEVDAVMFLYDNGGVQNGTSAIGNWQVVTSSNSIRTVSDTGVAIVAGTWVKLRIEINAAATSVVFKIDGVSVATHTTNIPTFSAGRFLNVKQGIAKTAGTTNRNVFCDYIGYQNYLTTPR
ncbi:hypothetical protein [Flavobacterium sp. 102]|uniref:hypothetical protein n=1 Tax=Flavobacterium sp. 102 TaxID=2135623 RepID=UPI000EABC6A3|nr:hypothetical protein [Flavobacterium sp. 102]RKS00408.1 hypothetical protein C8C84_0016 [Flavobacterium sp. 102]RKS03734.1 hypothetical protein C8C84_3500 [Flavobacterium sp. 102]